MTAKQKEIYGDIDDLLIFAGGYLTALKQASGNDKLVKRTENVINQIRERHQKQIDKLYAPAKPHPQSLNLKFPMGG
jgi:hypothetical protein